MVKRKQISLTEKAKINELAEQNVSNREIAVKTSFNESSVRRFLKNIVRRKNWKGRKDRAEKNAQMNGRTVLLWKQASGIASKML